MRTININPSKETARIVALGRQGENLVTEVVFDISGLIEDYGEGVPVVLHKRPLDELPYEVTITVDSDTVTWSVGVTDTAQPGEGWMELQWFVDEAVAKSQVYKTFILKSTESLTSPKAGELWVMKLESLSSTAVEAAESAAESAAASAEYSGGIVSIEQTVLTTESSGENVVTITKADGTTTDFYVYNGAKGDKGDTGNLCWATFDVIADTGELELTMPDSFAGLEFTIDDESGYLEVTYA